MLAHFTNSVRGEYASRIDSLAALSQTTADVFNGWLLPASPGSVAAPHKVHQLNGDVFVCPSVETKCETKQSANSPQSGYWHWRNCVIRHRTSVCDCARIDNSVIGDSVSAREGAFIQKSIIRNNAVIGENVAIEKSIVSEKHIVRRAPPRTARKVMVEKPISMAGTARADGIGVTAAYESALGERTCIERRGRRHIFHAEGRCGNDILHEQKTLASGRTQTNEKIFQVCREQSSEIDSEAVTRTEALPKRCNIS